MKISEACLKLCVQFLLIENNSKRGMGFLMPRGLEDILTGFIKKDFSTFFCNSQI